MTELLYKIGLEALLFTAGLLNILSQLFLYIVTGGATQGNESTSGACARRGFVKREKAIDFICFWEKDHCAKSAWNDFDWAEEYRSDPYFERGRPE